MESGTPSTTHPARTNPSSFVLAFTIGLVSLLTSATTSQKGKHMEPNITTADIARAMAQGQRKLGALVYWQGLTNVRVDRALFRQGFRVAGMGRAVQADPKPEATLHTAASMAARSQGREEPRAKVELKAKGTHATYAVLMRRDVGDTRRYIEEARVAVERGDRKSAPTPTIEVDQAAPVDDNRDALIERIVDAYVDLRSYVATQEFSETLVRALSGCGGLSLRAGVYFVPVDALDSVRLLRAFVERETRASMTVWEIAATDENASTARRDAREAFQARITELVDEVRTFTAENTVEQAATKSINARAKKFRELDGRVGLWADVLGDHVDELRGVIAEAKRTLLGSYLAAIEGDDGDLPALTDDATVEDAA